MNNYNSGIKKHDMTSGYANYDVSIERIHTPPAVVATPATLSGFGRLADGCVNVDGPATGGRFVVRHTTAFVYAHNHGFNGDEYVTGKHIPGLDTIVTREANRHDDGEQLFCAIDSVDEFVLLLAPPSAHVTPDDFVRFTVTKANAPNGVIINRNTWHQPPYTTRGPAVIFTTAQAASHHCVLYDSLIEHNVWIRIY